MPRPIFVPPATYCEPTDFTSSNWGTQANNHVHPEYAFSSRIVAAGSGLIGGGDLSQDIALSVFRPFNADLLQGYAASAFALADHDHGEQTGFATEAWVTSNFLEQGAYLASGDAAAILALVKTVDGTGSGLDADRLQGYTAAQLIGAGGTGVTDHGMLDGLADDDHPQYLTEARADAIYTSIGFITGNYYTAAQIDAAGYMTTAIGDARYVPRTGGSFTGFVNVDSSHIGLGTTNVFGVGEAFNGLRVRGRSSAPWSRGIQFFKEGTGVSEADQIGSINLYGDTSSNPIYYHFGKFAAEWLKQSSTELWTIGKLNALDIETRTGVLDSLASAVYLQIQGDTYMRQHPTGDNYLQVGRYRTAAGTSYLDLYGSPGYGTAMRLSTNGGTGSGAITFGGTGTFLIRDINGAGLTIESGVNMKQIQLLGLMSQFGNNNINTNIIGNGITVFASGIMWLQSFNAIRLESFDAQGKLILSDMADLYGGEGVIIRGGFMASAADQEIKFGSQSSIYMSTGIAHSRFHMLERPFGTTNTAPMVAVARNTTSPGSGGTLALQEGPGTWRYYYAKNGVLMQANGAQSPGNLSPGGEVVVGSQASTIRVKDIVPNEEATMEDIWLALQAAAGQVYRFLYKDGLFAGDVLEGLVLQEDHPELYRYGTMRDTDVPEGRTLNTVTLFGDLLRAVNDLNHRITKMEATCRP